MNVLAIRIHNPVGWALASSGAITSGTQTFLSTSANIETVDFARWLSIWDERRIERVITEDRERNERRRPQMRLLDNWCRKHDAAFELITPAEIKRHWGDPWATRGLITYYAARAFPTAGITTYEPAVAATALAARGYLAPVHHVAAGVPD